MCTRICNSHKVDRNIALTGDATCLLCNISCCHVYTVSQNVQTTAGAFFYFEVARLEVGSVSNSQSQFFSVYRSR